jgi:hypothetical protein
VGDVVDTPDSAIKSWRYLGAGEWEPNDAVRYTTSPGGGIEKILVGTLDVTDQIGGGSGRISVNSFGASPGASWEVNRDAFNAAFAAAEAVGATVVAAPGVYTAKGVVIGSHVFVDMPGVTIISPDGQAPNAVATLITTTSGDAVGSTVTVADASRIEIGTLVAVHSAGPEHDVQATVLTANIDDSQTTGITLTTLTGFSSAGVLRIGSELISYTGRSGGTLSGVTRGYLGTTPAAHTTSEWIRLALHHYAVVKSVSGNVVTLDEPVSLSVTGTTISVGSRNIKMRHLTVNGNAPTGGAVASVYNVVAQLCTDCVFDNLVCVNADQGGFTLTKGSRHNAVRSIRLHDCGIPSISKGAAFWMYQGCRNNRVEGITITGRAWVGIYLDDRTSTADPWDRSNTDNVIVGINIDVDRVSSGYPSSINLVGAKRNVIANGTLRGSIVGISISQGSQGTNPDGSKPQCVQNEFASLKIASDTPYIAEAPGNVFHDIDFDDAVAIANPTNAGANLIINSKIVRNGPIESGLKFGAGTAGAPSITFSGDPDTGLYSYAANTLGFAVGGVVAARLYATEYRLGEGVHIAVGTATGSRIGFVNTQKLAFWGGTPVVQPSAVANAADSADAVVKLNELLVKLRSIGLIAAV